MSAPAAKKTILIIEDDSDIREVLIDVLDLNGFTVESASNGEEGLEILRRMRPDLILLDLMMPVMDGYAFRQEQRKSPDWNQIPVVIMSADGRLNDKQEQLGAAAYLKKPLEMDDLVSLIERLSSSSLNAS